MKALVLSEVFPPRHGGSGRWLWEVYRRFPREDVTILAGDHPDASLFDRGHDVRVSRTSMTLDYWGLLSLAGLRAYYRLTTTGAELLERSRCDRIHCARLLPEGWIAWVLKLRYGVGYVCYVHGEELHYGVSSRELRWMMRRVLRGADVLIANSQNTRRLLVDHWKQPPGRIAVLHPGVDASRFRPVEADPGLRERLGWHGRAVILTVGRLQKRKGQDMLIRALPRILERVPNALYAIAGGGEQLPELQRLTRELDLEGRVQFLGEPEDADLIACYQQCDLFVLPNRDVDGDIEGFGIALVEAQACGKAVIAGRSGGTSEAMQVGRTGLVVDCSQPESVADAVVTLLLDEGRRVTMGEAGRQWVEEHLDWTRLAMEAHAILSGELLVDKVIYREDKRRQ